MNSGHNQHRISTRNAEVRAMLFEARQYRLQGRPALAEIVEAEAVKYRAVTLRLVSEFMTKPETVFA